MRYIHVGAESVVDTIALAQHAALTAGFLGSSVGGGGGGGGGGGNPKPVNPKPLNL